MKVDQMVAMKVGDRIKFASGKYGDEQRAVYEQAAKHAAETGRRYEIDNVKIGRNVWDFFLVLKSEHAKVEE